MTYVQPSTGSSRASTLIVVGAIHAAAIYGIITAFGFQLIPRDEPPPLVGTQVPTSNVPEDVPSETPNEKPRFIEETFPREVWTPPLPPVGGTTTLPPVDDSGLLTGGLGGSDEIGGGDIGTVEFPTASATPLFTPKGPRPRGDQARWVTQEDYPTRALNAGLEGLTRVRLSVAASGRATGCEVISSAGSPLLDEAACDGLLRRARFNPATDDAGEATGGTFVTTVRWELPD